MQCSLARFVDETARQPLSVALIGLGIEAARDERQNTSTSDTRAIQLYLGHKNIQHTVRYTGLASRRFKDFWRD